MGADAAAVSGAAAAAAVSQQSLPTTSTTYATAPDAPPAMGADAAAVSVNGEQEHPSCGATGNQYHGCFTRGGRSNSRDSPTCPSSIYP